jgi:hypothetical protein
MFYVHDISCGVSVWYSVCTRVHNKNTKFYGSYLVARYQTCELHVCLWVLGDPLILCVENNDVVFSVGAGRSCIRQKDGFLGFGIRG